MKIEVIEFYPLEYYEEQDILTGTIRVKLPDLGISILGIYVSKNKGSWFFSLPGRKAIHHETGNEIYFPSIVFDDKGKQQELISAIKEQGKIFIEARLADLENNPFVFPPQKKEKERREPKALNGKENAASAKQMLSIEKPKPKERKEAIWIDPPPRKFNRR